MREVSTLSLWFAVVNQLGSMLTLPYIILRESRLWWLSKRPISQNLFLHFSSYVTPTTTTAFNHVCVCAAIEEIKSKTKSISQHTCRHVGKEFGLIRSAYAITET